MYPRPDPGPCIDKVCILPGSYNLQPKVISFSSSHEGPFVILQGKEGNQKTGLLAHAYIPVLERQRQKGQQLRIILIYIVSLGLTCATRDSTNKQTKILQNLSYIGVPGQLKARPYCKHINRQADSMKRAAATIFSSFFTSHTGSCCS